MGFECSLEAFFTVWQSDNFNLLFTLPLTDSTVLGLLVLFVTIGTSDLVPALPSTADFVICLYCTLILAIPASNFSSDSFSDASSFLLILWTYQSQVL